LAAGVNPFVLVVTDSSNNSTRDSFVITRGGDVTPPTIAHLNNFSVPYATSSTTISWNVSDDVKMGTVTINAIPVTGSLGAYSKSVNLLVGSDTVRIVALDSVGNRSTDSVIITRGGDITPPTVVHVNNSAVPYATSSTTVSWNVSDDVKMGVVTINGTPIPGSNGTYGKSVNLLVGSDTVRIVALDSVGNRSTDSVIITRGGDITPPAIVHVNNSAVPYATSSTTVSWSVSDDVKMGAVTINTVPITGLNGTYSKPVNLAVGNDTVRIVALDSAGNRSTDSVIITRGGDIAPPTIVRTLIPSSTAEYKKTYLVSYDITDNDAVASVIINHIPATKSGNSYSASITLSNPGANPIVVVAKDPTGNTSQDSISVTANLVDAQGNSYPIGTMPDGKIWMRSPLLDKDSVADGMALLDGKPATFYSWSAAMGLDPTCDANYNATTCALDTTKIRQGICPADWHIPTSTEWLNLLHSAAQGGPDSIGIFHLKANESAWEPGPGDDLFGMSLQDDNSWSGGGNGGQVGTWWTASPYNLKTNFGSVFRAQTYSGVSNNQAYISYNPKGGVPVQVRCLSN
jgi:uncharacterized protein (TIGR02145 family)